MTDDRLNEDEQRALLEAWVPPPELEDRSVEALRARGLLDQPRRGATMRSDERHTSVAGAAARRPVPAPALRGLGALAATLLVFLGGWVVGRGSDDRRDPRSAAPVPSTAATSAPAAAALATSPAFLLLLWERAGVFAAPEGAEREYAAWARARAEAVVDGAELASEARVLVPGEPRSGETPRVDASGAHIAGYFVIRAASAEAAAAIAAGCPHLKYGGTIEVRPLVGS